MQIAIDWLIGVMLFASTAAVVWWQNSRLTVLYDLSGVLEPAMRIAQGELPYLDFPFPYAPLTFVMQAAVIRFTGAVYWHHIAYCCVVAGLGTVLTWRILLLLFSSKLTYPRLTAFILSLPAVVLGLYCIFPHPFYDPDAIFIVLLSLFLLLRLEAKGFPPLQTVLAGALLVLPLFFKQNIGIAFAGSAEVSLFFLIGSGLRRKTTIRPYMLLIAGIALGFGIALLVVHNTVGIENYKYWTITFAALRRTPPLNEMLLIYSGRTLILSTISFLLGAFLMRQDAGVKRWPSIVAILLMTAPFVWAVAYLLIDIDPSERGERLVGLWPLVLVTLLAISYVFVRQFRGLTSALPFIIFATVNGVFLSQQLWGSTYGVWPLLMIMIGLILLQLFDFEERQGGATVTVVGVLISISVLVAGGFYVYSNERLDYVNFQDGEMAHSKLPQLSGMSMRGDWLPDFDELVDYTDKNIPREDGILYLPGEDLFYYTTGRHPHFPVLLFDVTNNPYSPPEIRERVIASDIEWIIVKNDTEVEQDNMIDSKSVIFDLLKPDFRSIDSLNNYEIYKRRHADDPPDEEDDSAGDGSDDSDDSDDASDSQ